MGTATAGYVADSGNVLVDSLAWDLRWVSAGTGPTESKMPKVVAALTA